MQMLEQASWKNHSEWLTDWERWDSDSVGDDPGRGWRQEIQMLN